MHQRHQLGPHLLPHLFGQVTARFRYSLGGRAGEFARQGASDMPDAAPVLHPGRRMAQKGAEALGAITRHAADAIPVQARSASTLKEV